MTMADRWDHCRTISTLVSSGGLLIGQAVRWPSGDGWEAWAFRPRHEYRLNTFPTRAAAMRAVASACDRKKIPPHP
jgi:hypothetical protein